jgi:uncharacterized membrane protein
MRRGYDKRSAGRRAAVRAATGFAAGVCGLFASLALAAWLIVSGTIPEGAADAAVVASVLVAALIFTLRVFARAGK